MSILRIAGRCIAKPPPADWQARLRTRLGTTPRRLGPWAELGLYGALECLADAGEVVLPAKACLVLSSRQGPVGAMLSAFRQARENLPMPVIFLQTQPSQLLAALAAHLRWHGDARFITHPDPGKLLHLAAVQSQGNGLLVGWVEEAGLGYTEWLRLIPSVEPAGHFRQTNSLEEGLACASHLRVTANEVFAMIANPDLWRSRETTNAIIQANSIRASESPDDESNKQS